MMRETLITLCVLFWLLFIGPPIIWWGMDQWEHIIDDIKRDIRKRKNPGA